MASRWSALACAMAAVACQSSPSGPTQSNTPPGTIVITGRLTATATGQPLENAAIDVGGAIASSAADGSFRHELPRAMLGTSQSLRLSGSGLVDRLLFLAVSGSRQVSLDAIDLGSGFNLDYYRMLARDSLSLPAAPRALRRWTTAPRVYVKTVDETGIAIDPVTLETVVGALEDEASAWTGGRFGLAAVERGSGSREGVNGWITVKWPAPTADNLCGRAQVAVNGGWIELYYHNRNCACRGSRIDPGTARHELGHAMGFYHTNDPADAMFPAGANCDDKPSARERFHAAVVYSRPVGNLDPDTDPATSVARSIDAPIVVD